jgi:hypothetical protein
LESHLRKEQAGFRKGWSCIDLINTLTIILKQSNKWKGTLYPAFVDFEKAFDSLARDVSWQVMKIYTVTKKMVKMIKGLYEGFKCRVVH